MRYRTSLRPESSIPPCNQAPVQLPCTARTIAVQDPCSSWRVAVVKMTGVSCVRENGSTGTSLRRARRLQIEQSGVS